MSDCFDYMMDAYSDCFDYMMDAYSDCFDYMMDAYSDCEAKEGCWSGSGYRRKVIFSNRNPLYYHKYLEYKSIDRETNRSYLIDFGGKILWVPKSICKKLDVYDKTIYIHANTLSSIEKRAEPMVLEF